MPIHLPTLNAALNSSAALLLILGYIFIKRKNITAHRAAMGAAFACSTLFLISYLIYHATSGSTPFEGEGPIRIFYFSVLISHTILATAIVPMVLVTVIRAIRGDFARHAALARWTWPLWMYVSVTGVVVYWMLYQT